MTAGGRRYIYHNTLLQPPYASESAPGPSTLGAGQGAGGASSFNMSNTVSQNNVGKYRLVPGTPGHDDGAVTVSPT